ncbi:MAG TPA: chorismate mutase [Stellaceae bacterium]|nr:chorismate mutase [Stellaceae bacterium]
MRSTVPDLADLRRRIDVIDDRLHDLLIERAEIVGAVAASKTAGGAGRDAAFYQPAREAEILRRLAARHRGALPFASVARIWRELLAATVGLETRFAVAVFAPSGETGCWDLARDHYGSQTPMSAHHSADGVINAVNDGRAAIGVLPMPHENEADPWWPRLLPADGSTAQVVARLPFGGRGNARDDGGDALAIGHGFQQQTGSDRTLFAILPGATLGRARLLRLLQSADLACLFCAAAGHGDGTIFLIELDGFVRLADPRLALLCAESGIAAHSLFPFGGYAVPLCSAVLSGSTAKAEPA